MTSSSAGEVACCNGALPVHASLQPEVGQTCDVDSAESVSETESQQEHPVDDGPVNVFTDDACDNGVIGRASPCVSIDVKDKSLYCADMSSAKLVPVILLSAISEQCRILPLALMPMNVL